MNYYFYNTDAQALISSRRTRFRVLIDRSFAAVGGGRQRFGEQLRQLNRGDVLLMYEDKVGIVAVGRVKARWDGQSHTKPWYYVPAEMNGLTGGPYEYRIKVAWFLERSDKPITLEVLRRRFGSAGFTPRGTIKKIVKHRAEIENLIEELRPADPAACADGRWWVYKCNNRNHPHQVYSADWEEVFSRKVPRSWGSTEIVPSLGKLAIGDFVFAYQTDRNELVGLARVHALTHRRGHSAIVLRPIRRIGLKVRPLKAAHPAIDRMDAFKAGPIKTLYKLTDKEARQLLNVTGIELQFDADQSALAGSPGAGFQNDPEERRRVEQAAVRAATTLFRREGWIVEDVSQEDRGYDLHCAKGGREAHVEVKGTSGGDVRFVMTANEKLRWEVDSMFVLAVVIRAGGPCKESCVS